MELSLYIYMDKFYQYFGSGAGIFELSNFSACHITGQVPLSTKIYTFPSAEHFYVAHFLCPNLACVERLAIGGDLSTFDGLLGDDPTG